MEGRVVFFILFIFGRAVSSLLHGLFVSRDEWGLFSSCGAWACLIAEHGLQDVRVQL